ncbi:MAG: hypothetical protein HW383_436 [Candidatus Magasanikbacteria bacterium]|nr:hypothetical protein [Candidatus Magasanikbacteria bacterium]
MTALILVALFAIGLGRAYYRDLAIRKEISRLEQQVQALESKKFQSLELLSQIKSPQFVEEAARLTFNLKKPGEHVAVVTGTAIGIGEMSGESGAASPNGSHLSIPKKWWYYFFHKSALTGE